MADYHAQLTVHAPVNEQAETLVAEPIEPVGAVRQGLGRNRLADEQRQRQKRRPRRAPATGMDISSKGGREHKAMLSFPDLQGNSLVCVNVQWTRFGQ